MTSAFLLQKLFVMKTGTLALFSLLVVALFLFLLIKTRPYNETRFQGSSFTGSNSLEIPNSIMNISSEKECLLASKANPMANACVFDRTRKTCQPMIVKKNFTLKQDANKISIVFDCVC